MGGISWTAQWKRLPASSMNRPWQNGSNLHLTRDVVDSVSVSTISKENRRKWCKPRGNRDVLSWMFLHPIEPGLSGARAGQSRGDGARTVSTPFTTPPPIPCSCNVPAYTLELAPRKLADARKQVWCRLFPGWSSEGSTETLRVAIWLLSPLLLLHE